MSEIAKNIENEGPAMQVLIQQAKAYVFDAWTNYDPMKRYNRILSCLNYYEDYKCMVHGYCHDMHFWMSRLFEGYASISMYAAEIKTTSQAFIVDLYKVSFDVPDVTKMTNDLPEIICHAWRITIEVLNGRIVWTVDKTHGQDIQGRVVIESELSHISDITFDSIIGFESRFINTFAFVNQERFIRSFRDWLTDTVDVSELLPIMRYLNHGIIKGSDGARAFFRDLVFDSDESESAKMYEVFKNRKGTKDCLNAIYDPSGKKRLTKNAFGGLGEIRDLADLMNAVAIVEALSPFEAYVFESIDLSRVIELWTHVYYEMTVKIKMYHKIISFFGVKEKTLFALLRILTDVHRNPHTDLVWAYDQIMEIEDLLTYGDPHEKEAAAVIIKAAVDRFNADQDFRVVAQLISEEIRRMKDPNVPVEWEFYDLVDGHMITPEIKVVSPKMTHDLVTWGAEQNNCIGNYTNDVRKGRSYIIGFQKPNGKWWGHAEIKTNSMRVAQLLGHSNQALPLDIHDAIMDYLKSMEDFRPVQDELDEQEPF